MRVAVYGLAGLRGLEVRRPLMTHRAVAAPLKRRHARYGRAGVDTLMLRLAGGQFRSAWCGKLAIHTHDDTATLSHHHASLCVVTGFFPIARAQLLCRTGPARVSLRAICT